MLAVACLDLARQLALSWDSPSYSVCGAGFSVCNAEEAYRCTQSV